MTTEKLPHIGSIDEYRRFANGVYGVDSGVATDSALRFRVLNGDFDTEVIPSAKAGILSALEMDGNLRYQILD